MKRGCAACRPPQHGDATRRPPGFRLAPTALLLLLLAPLSASRSLADTPPPAMPQHDTGGSFADNRYVHQWIAAEAFRLFTNHIAGADLAAHLGTLAGSFDDSDNTLLEGARDEDVAGENPAPLFSLYKLFPYTEHFCAGADGAELDVGLNSYPAAVSRAQWYWDQYARPRYPASKASSFYYLGHVAHLLADMTIPAHTHNDEHIAGDSYEGGVATDSFFKQWFAGCTRSGLASLWQQPPRADLPDLRSLFQRTADYTEDYDSDDANGDVANGALPLTPADYPATWHRPDAVSRSGGFSTNELAIIAADLMPFAIRRVADLYRLFYRAVDATPPEVAMLYPAAADGNNPDWREDRLPFTLTATGSDAQSGILRRGFRFEWRQGEGANASAWAAVTPAPGLPEQLFSPHGDSALYAFRAISENGGGLLATSTVTYIRIRAHAPLILQGAPTSDAAAGCFVITWPSQAGCFYALDRSTNLTAGASAWQLRAAPIAATPPLNCHTDDVAGLPRAFYRVRTDTPIP
jgi:hypothetical protein